MIDTIHENLHNIKSEETVHFAGQRALNFMIDYIENPSDDI